MSGQSLRSQQTQTQRQGLRLTPGLTQSLRILQLSAQELELEIAQALLRNPLLVRDEEEESARGGSSQGSEATDTHLTPWQGDAQERLKTIEEEPAAPGAMPGQIQMSWEGDGSVELQDYYDSDWQQVAPAGGRGELVADEHPGEHECPNDLRAHLKAQARHLRLSEIETASLHYLIDNLDERGFLTTPLHELVAALVQEPDHAQEALAQLQIAHAFLCSMEPCGVGASDALDALRVQTRCAQAGGTLGKPEAELVLRLLARPIGLLQKKHVRVLARQVHAEVAQVQAALSFLQTLNPYPAHCFDSGLNHVVRPEIWVRAIPADGGGVHFRAQLNWAAVPRLKLDAVIVELMRVQRVRGKAATDKPERGAQGGHVQSLEACVVEARGLIRAVTQRFDTLLRVAQAIVVHQQSFFIQGESAMRPLTLQAIADTLGVHESTVSRATVGKYMDTPRGTFELRYFFDAALGDKAQGATSGTAVRSLMRQWIEQESKSHPLSDKQLAQRLESQGIFCARRTVAKYRESLRIPTASLRRVG